MKTTRYFADTDTLHIEFRDSVVAETRDAELFSNACFNYPTLGDLYKTATYDAMRESLRMAPPQVKPPPKAQRPM